MYDDQTLRKILLECRTIAVVGLSDDPGRPSNEVARYLQKHGYRIVPVNPRCTEILGAKCYPDLRSIPERIDMVDVFRKPADCAPIAAEAVAIGARVLWLQLGIANEDARQLAEAAGLQVVMDRCVKIEHARLIGA